MSETVKAKFECPFDLETIFTVQVDYRNLKGIIEFILERLHKGDLADQKQDKDIKDLDVKMMSKLMQVDK